MKTLTEFTFLFILLCLLNACSVDQPMATPSATAAATGVNTATSSPTPTETPVSTITVAPTATFISTLEPGEKLSQVESLLENNGECDLPCWWGITPGITQWEDARSFLSQFIQIDDAEPDEQGFVPAYIPISKDIAESGAIVQSLIVENGIVKEIQVYDFNWPTYALSAFLQKNGKPTEVWVHSYSSQFGAPPPFAVMLFYPEKGIYANFSASSDSSEYTGFSIHACMKSGPSLILWSPEEALPFEKFEKRHKLGYSLWDKPLASLEDATGMSVDVFYEVYKDPDREPCFKSPRYFWPEP